VKILLVTEFFPRSKKLKFTGGVEVRTYYLAKALKKNHHLKVISRSTSHVPASLKSIFSRATFSIQAVIQGLKFNPDLVEGSNFVSYLPSFFIAKIKQVPAIAWYPDVFMKTWQQHFGALGKIGELVEKLTLLLPWDHFIALSQQTKQKLLDQNIPTNRVTVIYPGINTDEISKIKSPKYKQPTICCISRLVSYKRVADLIQALAICKKTLPDLSLLIIGTGPQEKKLRCLATDLNLNQSIIWKQNLSRQELLKSLKASHLHALPSIVEGFGLVTLEALASSIPYVNANTPINKEITHNSLGGLLFKPKDPRDLSQKIIKLLTNTKLRTTKKTEAKKLLQNYSWQKSATQTLNVYNKMLR